jgi:hypothetical protein
MTVLTNRQRREVEEDEAKARSLIADIVPMLSNLPVDALPEVSKHLEKALDAAKSATCKLKDGEKE